MSRQYLNLSMAAWRQLRRNWRLPLSPMLFWQTLVPGAVFSGIAKFQQAANREELAKANFRDAVVVLGYWRSGTTLLHELLCLDKRYTYPTTHACMNPHHFLFSEAGVVARGGAIAKRPMDDMEVQASSPQEDEFALLSLGARSPYEALPFPKILPAALKLTDPHDLSPEDERTWREVFREFLAGVSLRGGRRPLILKSPTHTFRVDTLREMLPEARFLLIVRDPYTNFESVVRMWRKMFETYAIGDVISEDEIRECVLEDRMRCEQKLAKSTASLPANRFATISYERLVANPAGIIEELYPRLELGDFSAVREPLTAEMQKRSGYHAKGALPSEAWRKRIDQEWAPLLAQHASLG